MKILQVIPFFTPLRGGSVVVPYYLSRELAKAGHEVTIITTDFGFNKAYSESVGVEVISFKCKANFGLFLYSPDMKKWLKDNIKEYDVIHLHNFRSYQNNIAYYYANKYGIPYVLQAHGSLPRIIEKQNLKKLYDLVWGNKILNDASTLIAVSRVEAEQYRRITNNDKITLIPNCLDIERFKILPSYGKFKNKYNIEEKFMILFLGRIHRGKGIDFLIKSFDLLCKEMDDIILVIVGPDDGYKTYLERLVKGLNIINKVKFVEFTNDISEVYRDADILVYPAIYEIFGLVPFEAIMCGTPIIVTDDCGCGELVKEANCGNLVKYGDLDDLNRKMRHILENPEKWKDMVERGNKYIVENLTWDKVVKGLEEIYEDCLYNNSKNEIQKEKRL